MLKFIIRLDDACENMKEENWIKIEKILDKYKIKPIVGIIPDNQDKEFIYGHIDDFWNKYPQKWKNKRWIIAQHGLNHNLSKTIRTEFSGKTLQEQEDMLKKGYQIMIKNNITPDCFFAPAHTFDNNTIDAINNLKYYKFISDGYAFYPYSYRNVLFFPNVFDTPHKLFPFGIFTFVYHPNNMKEGDFNYLEKFIEKNLKYFNIDINELIKKYSKRRKNIFDSMIGISINIFRKVRGENEK